MSNIRVLSKVHDEKKEIENVLSEKTSELGTESREIPSRRRTVYFIPGFKDESSVINFKRQTTKDRTLIIGREGKTHEAHHEGGLESACFKEVKGNYLFTGNETEDHIQVVSDHYQEMMAQAVMNRTTSIDSGIDCTHVTVCDESDLSMPVAVRAPLASPEPDINAQNGKAQSTNDCVIIRADIVESDKQPTSAVCEETYLSVETTSVNDKLFEQIESTVETSCSFTTYIERTDIDPKLTESVKTTDADISKNENIEVSKSSTLFGKLKRTKKNKSKCSTEGEKGDKKCKNEIAELKNSSSVFGKFRLSKRIKSKTLLKHNSAHINKELCQSQSIEDADRIFKSKNLADSQTKVTGDTDRNSHSTQLSYVVGDTSTTPKEKSKNFAINQMAPSAYGLHSPHKLVKPAVKYKENLFKMVLSKAFLSKSQSKLSTNDQSAFTTLKNKKVSKFTSIINTTASWDSITDSDSEDSVDSNEHVNDSSSSDEDDFESTSKTAKIEKNDLHKEQKYTCNRQCKSQWNRDNSSDDSKMHAKKKRVFKSYNETKNSEKGCTHTKAAKKKINNIGANWNSETDSDSDSSSHSQSFSVPKTKVIQNRQVGDRFHKGHGVYERFRKKKLGKNDISWAAPQTGHNEEYTDSEDSEDFSSLLVKRPPTRFSVSESSAFQPYRHAIDVAYGTKSPQDQSESSLDDSCVLQTYSSDLCDSKDGHSSDSCESNSSLEESPNTLAQYTVSAHSSEECIVETSDMWHSTNHFALERSDSIPLSPCLKRSQSLKEKRSAQFLPQPYLLPVDDIDVHRYPGGPDLEQGRIYSIMDQSSNQRETNSTKNHLKNVSFRNELLCSGNLCSSPADTQTTNRENYTGDSMNTTEAPNTKLSESDLCRKILGLYVDMSQEAINSNGQVSQPENLNSSPFSNLMQRSKCTLNTELLKQENCQITEEYSTAKFVPAALQRTQAKMRRIPSFDVGSEDDGAQAMKRARSTTLDRTTRKSILKEKSEMANVQRRDSYPRMKSADLHKKETDLLDKPAFKKMSSGELEKMTRLHTFFNGQRQVKYVSYRDVDRIAKDFPPPKPASRINWSDRLVDVSCKDYTPRNTPTKPHPILQKKFEKFVYPYTDDVPSPILITRLRRSKSSRRYREWP